MSEWKNGQEDRWTDRWMDDCVAGQMGTWRALGRGRAHAVALLCSLCAGPESPEPVQPSLAQVCLVVFQRRRK